MVRHTRLNPLGSPPYQELFPSAREPREVLSRGELLSDVPVRAREDLHQLPLQQLQRQMHVGRQLDLGEHLRLVIILYVYIYIYTHIHIHIHIHIYIYNYICKHVLLYYIYIYIHIHIFVLAREFLCTTARLRPSIRPSVHPLHPCLRTSLIVL